MEINLIVCCDKNNGIGKDNKMPWPKFSEDLKNFRRLTIGNPVIMGRKTQESIGIFLEGRPNLIISTQPQEIKDYTSARYSHSFNIEDALKWVGYDDIFIIGGQSIYEQTINIADRIYMTRIKKEYECDRFFPEIDKEKFELSMVVNGENEHFEYEFLRFDRK